MGQDLESMFREHWASVRRFAVRRVGEGSADDLAASVFELAYRKMPKSHPHPVGWLFRTAENLAKSQLRGLERDRRAVVGLGYEIAARGLGEPDDDEILRALLEQLGLLHG